MEYLLIGIAVLAVIGVGTALIAARGRGGDAPYAPEADTPLGDTSQHADADAGPHTSPTTEAPDPGRFKRDPVGGEAEAAQYR